MSSRAPIFALSIVVFAACGSDIGDSPCDRENPPASCSGPDAPLPPPPDARPMVEIDAPDAPPPPPDANCPSVIVDVKAVVPTVALVIDRSFSMTETFGASNRWEAEKTALVDPQIGVVTSLASRVRFVATTYTRGHTDTNGDGEINGEDDDEIVCPLLESTTPAATLEENYDAIKNLLDSSFGPQGDTPTGESVSLVTSQLAALPPIDPDNPEPRYIVLSTDGEPDTCQFPNSEFDLAKQVSIDAVKAAFDQGIRTYVLSVGDDIGQDHLQDLANAGAGKPVGDGNPNNDAPFFVGDDPADLVSEFETILGQVAKSCTFNLDADITPGREQSGDVRLDGTMLEYETDWRVIDSDTIELVGAACDAYLGDPDAVITAEFPCGAVSPE